MRTKRDFSKVILAPLPRSSTSTTLRACSHTYRYTHIHLEKGWIYLNPSSLVYHIFSNTTVKTCEYLCCASMSLYQAQHSTCWPPRILHISRGVHHAHTHLHTHAHIHTHTCPYDRIMQDAVNLAKHTSSSVLDTRLVSASI